MQTVDYIIERLSSSLVICKTNVWTAGSGNVTANPIKIKTE